MKNHKVPGDPKSKLWSKIFRGNNKTKVTKATGTIEEKVKIELSTQSSIKNAASWFYWIAGFSIINTLIMFFDGGINFVVGLGIAQLVDGYAYIFSEYFGITAFLVGFMVNLLIAGIFIYFGIMAKKHKKWSFIIGMSLYGVDAIIFIIFKDYLGLAFHIFALISIFRGFRDLAKATDTTKNNEPNIDLYINS